MADMTREEIEALVARLAKRGYMFCGVGDATINSRFEPDPDCAIAAAALSQTLARNAELEAALADAEEVLSLVEHPAQPDPWYHAEVKALGQRIGFGALMTTASAGWREVAEANGDPTSGVFVAGPCIGTVQGTLRRARAALAPTGVASEGERT